jgi:hypothetical protein
MQFPTKLPLPPGVSIPETKPVAEQVKENVVAVSANRFEAHPESYYPRVFIETREDKKWYEILMTGEAIPWTKSPEGLFDFWIVDVNRISDFGMSRKGKPNASETAPSQG